MQLFSAIRQLIGALYLPGLSEEDAAIMTSGPSHVSSTTVASDDLKASSASAAEAQDGECPVQKVAFSADIERRNSDMVCPTRRYLLLDL